MNLCRLELIAFRNYEKLSCTFEKDAVHVFYGKNAQGKTNLIESVYYLSHLRSFRTPGNAHLIQNDHDFFRIRAVIETLNRKEDMKVVVFDHEKHLYVYDQPIHRYSDFLGHVNAVLFCPDDLMLFTQSPKIRRRFIDMELMKLSRTYTSTLNHYQKILKERNALLKSQRIDDLYLDTLTEQLIEDEVVILNQRITFLADLMKKARRFYAFFSQNDQSIDAGYCSFVDTDDLKANLKKAYEKSKVRDKIYKQTLIGIHRDDIEFLIDGIPVKDHASQGQKRSILLSMKLALCRIIYEKKKEYPILLLDDVLSELDETRRQKLMGILPEHMQIFITTTERVDKSWFKNKTVRFYHIEQGHIQEVTG